MDTKSLSRKKSDGEMVDANDDENLNSGHKPFLMGLHSHKITPIGYDFHQVEVPAWNPPPPNAPSPSQQLRKRDISRQPKPTFLASRISEQQIAEYLTFVQSYYEEKNPEYFSQGSISLERTKAKALQFLHKMNYNVIKAKFYTLFPTYITYNSFRLHDPLNISDEQMERKTRDYLEGLKNTKEKDTEKWIQDLQQCLENRTPIAKFISLVEVGKMNKLEVPQHIKEQIQRAQKAGKQIKKSLSGNKYTIEALREKKKVTEQHKIITGQMISLEDTVNRCEDWMKKLQNFQETYFTIDQSGKIIEKKQAGKIQFKLLNALVNQYSNLPLSQPSFQQNVKKKHTETIQLLESMPTFNRVAKTRTAKQQTVNKIPYSTIKKYLKKIEDFPVWHEEFSNFQINMRQSLELIERLSMFLQDPLSEKTSKILNNYVKLISDVQIDNNIEKRLKQRQEYNEIMEKIKKQITNPGKVESIRQAYNKLKEKGIKEMEDSGYQQKILLYLGWHQSQQKLKQPKPIVTKLDLIIRQLEIKKKLVNVESFKEQLESTKKQLNISREDLDENYKRLQMQKQQEQSVKQMLKNQNPNLQLMIEKLKECINCGLSFPAFQQLYETIMKYFQVLLKIHYLLKIKPENLQSEVIGDYYFTADDCDFTLNMISYQAELKDLKTKEGADMLLKEIRENPFPKYMKQCIVFEEFMKKGEQWAQKVRQMIKNFSEKGENIDVKELQQSKYFIHSRAIKEEIGRIELIMKWRQKIKKKLEDGKAVIFDQTQEEFLKTLQKDLIVFEASNSSHEVMQKQFLEYSKQKSLMINKILDKITNESQVDNICKLSEMNKFHRQIEKELQRHKIEDKIILEYKSSYHDEINLADEWKERYLMIKRCEKKKILNTKKDEGIGEDDKSAEPIVQRQALFSLVDPANDVSHSHNEVAHKKRFTIRNVEFTTNFKFLILILEFCKGYKLKFTLQELLKLKNTLSEINRFFQHYQLFNEKSDPSDIQLSNLEAEGSKIQLPVREYWILKKKNQYVLAWKQMADTILDSVPIINMQLKARKPQQLLTVLANKKLETEQANKNANEEKNAQFFSHKRERKPNSLYSNNEITLFFDQNIGQKVKKRKKGGNGDTEYRNTAVASQAKKNARNKLEDIERTEALLKGEISANFLIEDPKQYCICRFGEPNENTTMVQCEGKCEQWFHIECVGIKKHQAKGDTSYVCICCNHLYGLKTTGNFFWNYRQKISPYAFEEIVQQGKKLGIHTQQIKKIRTIDDKLQNWKESVNEFLMTVTRDEFNGKPLSDHEQKIYELYLMSFWLPTFHVETEILRRLLLISRGHQDYL